jgi:4-amino-4-deoxy-L-arabinose transferase-like glycosyltransferase
MQIASFQSMMSLRAFAVLTLSLLLPVILAIVVFPTPMYDTRELIAWGREFPLSTPDHPPIMAWVGGLVDRLFGTSAAAMVLAGQMLTGLGLWYFYLTLCLVSTRESAVFFTFLYGTSLYIVFGPLSFALNADLLQVTSWPAIAYYFLTASRSGGISRWMALGFWSAVAFMTKYNALVLFIGLGAAAAIVPAYRSAYRSYGLYVAALIGLALIAPHVNAVFSHRGALEYGVDHFDFRAPLSDKLRSLLEWGAGLIVCAVPAIFTIAFGIWTGAFRIAVDEPTEAYDTRSVLLAANIVMQALILGLIFVFGLGYKFRFSPPYVMMALLGLAPWIRWRADGMRWMDRLVVPFAGGLNLLIGVTLAVVYTFFASHSAMQEPTRAGAAAILADWRQRYACGPGYFFGIRQPVYGIGIEAGRNVTTIAIGDLAGAAWFDADRWRREGAVVIDTPEEARDWMAAYRPNPSSTKEYSVTLPLLRTHSSKQFTYSYHFIAPQACPPGS